MLSTMSSIRPRVFIRIPSADASRQRRPVARAASALPPNLPRHAAAMTIAHIPHACAESRRPVCVRRPLYAKNSGNSSTTTRSSSLSARSCAKPFAFGVMAPKRNAPNSAWMPISSVIQLDASRSTMVSATRFWLSPSLLALRAARRSTSGRTRRTTKTTYASARSVVRTPSIMVAARTSDTTHARMHHAVTSSTAAQVIARAPMRVRRRRRSTRMRARTGNAVMLIAAPMNSAKEKSGTPGGARSACR